ncbi:MFS transporter [Sphingobium sp. MK2]|uniref:MFS transporter n=1 Tax=Sphingobium sp. MK2 TaxID=3116540 RepID=UPI0032E35D72
MSDASSPRGSSEPSAQADPGPGTRPVGRAPASERWLVFVLTTMGMLAAVDRQILSLLINPIKADLGLTDVQISLVIGAAFALAHIAFTLPAGYIADSRSARMLVAGGGWVWSIMTMGCGVTTNFIQMFVMRAGVGAGEAAINPGALAILRRAIPSERRGRAFGTFYMSLMIGAAIAVLVGGLLVGAIERNRDAFGGIMSDISPWRVALFIVGGIGIPISALMLTIRIPAAQAARPPERGVAQDAPAKADADPVSFRAALYFISANRRFYLPLWVSNVAFMLNTAAFAGWLAAMAQRNFGLSAQDTGIALGSAMLIMPQLGLLVSGRLIDRLGVGLGLKGASLVGAIGATGFWLGATLVPQMQTEMAFFAALWISYLFCQAPMPAYATLLSAITPAELMGKITSIQLILLGVLGMAIGPTLVALVSDNFLSGPRAIANALSIVAFSVGWIPVVGFLALRRVL